MRLTLVRHAEAAPGHPDELRALTPDGRAQARALADQLVRGEPEVAAVLSSPLLRARETAAAIAGAFGLAAEVDDRLAPGASAGAVRTAAAGRGPHVVVVGHQPDCSEIAAELTGGPPPPFPPAGSRTIDLDDG